MASSSTRSLRLNNAAEQTSSHARRLIVLVPDYDINESLLARRIWTMALSSHSEVFYVALVHAADDEAHARRTLALLASLTRDDRLCVTTQLAVDSQWVKALRPLYRPDDVIVCLAEQTVKPLGRPVRPLSTQLLAEFGPPQVMTGISAERPPAHRQVWPTIRGAVPYAVVAGFLQFQMWITSQLARGAATTAVLALSVMVEFSMIWLWVSRVQ